MNFRLTLAGDPGGPSLGGGFLTIDIEAASAWEAVEIFHATKSPDENLRVVAVSGGSRSWSRLWAVVALVGLLILCC